MRNLEEIISSSRTATEKVVDRFEEIGIVQDAGQLQKM